RPLSADEFHGRSEKKSAPESEPWQSWADYGPAFHRKLAEQTGFGRVDIKTTMDRMTRCEHVDPLPRHPTLGVEKTIWVWLDRGWNDRPYWSEQLTLVSELIRFYGDRWIRWIPLSDGPELSIVEALEGDFRPGDLSIAVSEFCEPDGWSAFGRALVHKRQRPLSFSFTGALSPNPWESVFKTSRPATAAEDVDRVLAWLAFAVHFDAGHLRSVCQRLGYGPEVEFAVWTDARVIRGKNGFAWVNGPTSTTVKSAFFEMDDARRAEAIDLQLKWRDHHAEELVAQEYLNLRHHQLSTHVPAEARARAEGFWRRLAATDRGLPADHVDKTAVLNWI
ncbi:MAG: hypothetical protein AAFV29_28105, partial [Myxococcota bacterium]